MWNCGVSICDTACNGFGNSWGVEQETIAVTIEVPTLERESACLFPGIPA